jgi:hypothetical protein
MSRKSRRRVHVCTCQQCRQHPYSDVANQHRAINRVLVTLNEKNRRRFAGLLALQRGRGGVQAVIEITGLSRNTISPVCGRLVAAAIGLKKTPDASEGAAGVGARCHGG